MASIQQLPIEILEHIFVLSQSGATVRQVNKLFRQISQSNAVKAMYLQQRAVSAYNLTTPSDNKVDTTIIKSMRSKLLTPDVLRVLIRRGHDIQADDSFAFRLAAATNNLPIFECIISLPNVNVRVQNEYALRVASQNGFLQVVQKLIEMGADASIDQYFPLRTAVQNNQIQMARFLLNHSDIHADDDFCVRSAASDGNVEMFQLLMQHGANPHALDHEALILAAASGHLQLVQAILSIPGSNASARDQMPLRAAVQGSHWEVCRFLLTQNGVNPVETNLIERLSETKQWDFLLQVLARFPSIDVNVNSGIILNRACHAGDLILVQKLLSMGANAKSQTTLLASLVKQNGPKMNPVQMDIVRRLLRAGATMKQADYLQLRRERHPIVTIMGKQQYQKQIMN